ncbi:L,D-transpeptidase [Rhizosaccharibacter radicis]|uniref:L,D-transpeptidase n=1 Tax=Rhizosaccharibacter radicis TaxID=2782605 RepID=A0ABT1W3D8_9PROT|nr:L,D-transpeptidase [Acetobacteraceae bacterium KSS12]
MIRIAFSRVRRTARPAVMGWLLLCSTALVPASARSPATGTLAETAPVESSPRTAAPSLDTAAPDVPLPPPVPLSPGDAAADAAADAVPPEVPNPLPRLSPGAVAAANQLLRARMREVLGHALASPDPRDAGRALMLARAMLSARDSVIDRPQILLVVDRAPAVQRLWVVSAAPAGEPWTVLGAVRVSTGKPGRKEHFKTPVGVFANTPDILGYRAQGTFNENHIRGNGLKGMRVWDFGWQTTEDWRKPEALTAVRLEMHATDPTFLEGRLGRPDSEACIRIPAAFNQLMDQAGLIDAQLLALVPQDRAITALLPKGSGQTPLAGDRVVVVDSSEPTARPSDPLVAAEINQRFADWLAAQNGPAQSATSQGAAGQNIPGQNAASSNAAAPNADAPATGTPAGASADAAAGLSGAAPAATASTLSGRAAAGSPGMRVRASGRAVSRTPVDGPGAGIVPVRAGSLRPASAAADQG